MYQKETCWCNNNYTCTLHDNSQYSKWISNTDNIQQYKDILTEALEITHGARQSSYAHPSVNFARIAALWSVYFGIDITAEQVGVAMILFKVARLMHNPKHHDTLVDVAGYARNIEMIGEDPNVYSLD